MRTQFCTSLVLLTVTIFQLRGTADELGTRLLSQPAVSKNHVAFVYDHDLWIADRDGQNPRRLTSHEGDEASPQFSPDGQHVAFTAEMDGNSDVYIVSIDGGRPRRLTWHPSPDFVEGFTPDGKAVLFSSTRNVFTRRYRKLFTASIDGGFPTQLPIPNGLRAAYSADGKKMAYIPVAERFGQWKNYRGGTTSRIWIYDTGDHSVQQIRQIDGRCNDTDPCWIGGKVYFRSDRNGEFNLFSFDPASEAVNQLTHFDDFPIERLRGSSDTLIFEQAGFLHLFDPGTAKSTQLKVHVKSDMNDTRRRWVSGSNWIRGGDISPTGARAVLEFRGEIVTVPAKKGDARNITNSTAIHERSPAWSPDGKQIAYFSDKGGEYKLHIAAQDGSGDVEVIELEGHGFYEDPTWSPDGTKISYTDNSWSLYLLDLATKKSTKIGSAAHYGPRTLRPLDHNWSHDSRWIAYTLNTDAFIQQVFVYDVNNEKSHPVSDGMSEARDPVFDRSGKYLYFTSSTDAGPVKHWFAMSNADMEFTNTIFVAVLRNDIDSPLAPQSDEEKTSDDDEKKKNKDPDAKSDNSKSDDKKDDADDDESKDKIRIDFEGLDQRILELNVPAAVYSNLSAGPDEKIYFIKRDRDGESELVSYSLKDRESTTLLSGANGFAISHDGKKILYVAGRNWGIAPLGSKIDQSKTRLNVDQIRVRIDPPAEWAQIFEEAWRVNRDYFYDPNMHGADWDAMRVKYKPFVKDVVTRGDLNRVIRWMCSELAVGHHRVGGGDQRISVDRIGGGLLGADYKLENGRYRFAKIFGGLNWNRQMRAPLTEPGVSVEVGEYLLSVNGLDVTDKDNLFSFFENTAGKMVQIEVGPNPDGTDARTVTVVPIGDESRLRNRDWVEGNLKKVTDATGGRVAYVYVPNTAGMGHTYFKRYFFPQVNRQAIIVDERFNGGGQVADYYIDLLRRPYISHWATRYGKDFRTPTAAILGPKVMLIDETAGSGGDLLPWMFNKLELGTLVGKRTWGGLVGVLGFPTFIDGGSVSAPNLAFWTEDGFLVENVGVPPDVEVEQWPADIIAGRDPQLEKAIEIVLKQLEADPPREPKKPPFPIRVRKK